MSSFSLQSADLFCSEAILGQRDMRSYAMSVLSVDDKNYENPTEYVARNKFFFTKELPAAEPTESTISSSDLQSAVLEMLASDSLETLALKSFPAGPNYAGLKANLKESAVAYSAAIEDICQKRVPGDDDESKALLKEWRKTMHRYLREKLMFGMSGPSSSQTMAVLGYEECCRRLGAA